MTGCLVEHPVLREAFDRLQRRARDLAIVPFEERSGSGDLRYVWGKTNGQHVILTLVTAELESRAAELLSTLEGSVVGVSHSVQPAQGNAMRGSAPRVLSGVAELDTELLGQRVSLGALGFLQPNPQVAELAYRALTDGETVTGRRDLAFDLYAGAGVTTAVLRRSFARVVPCEVYAESAQQLGVAPNDVGDFIEQAVANGDHPDVVIANPPRRGLGARVCSGLLDLAAPELRIMSCGPEGLARDLAQLSSCYQLVSLRAFDTLPQTPHVELVARLQRRSD
jgi:23S rRNA (uracil1939-C5)-methyltransferase